MTTKKQLRIATRNSGFIDPEEIDSYILAGGYQALGRCLSEMTPQELIQEIKKSGLRGRGGAGFPTGVKWEFASRYQSDVKYVICNADEGDPGAYMDRAVLEGDPHSILEAMAIAGYAIGAHNGTIYIRAEYPLAVKRLRIAIEQAREYGLLGEDILGTGFGFAIEIKYGAGAFVCGEETALIRSMEGNRGEPYTKPPFPAEAGYWGKPTILNNVETLANIPAIIMKGSDWFRSIGTETTKGTKVFSLVGKINNVGLIEVPMGITLGEIIFDIGGGCPGGKMFKAVQTGGPSGGVLTYKDLDVRIDYENLAACESIMGSGGMIVMDEEACMVAVSKFFLDFTMDESCGKCAPCRIGSKRLWETLDKITRGKGDEEDLEKLENLARRIKDTALCGLGQTMPNPILSTLRVFREEYLSHVRDHLCPAGVCEQLLDFVILKDKCVGCTLCAKVCPVHAISGSPKEVHVIDREVCIKCGACIDKCKFDAIVRSTEKTPCLTILN
ncbi:MAG: NADH-ubiquinone oxidoreductase-F iron-sulfur binding region domain-containing protein [Syntrophotaleaceae bacterium]